ncbi:MAG: UDP-N-acetylmuramoyl-L-alanyl-D-glutamate--2,6-diaminopimelate ligase [Candidatus Omnitrophota bacterium]
MRLRDLLKDIVVETEGESCDLDIQAITSDSRDVRKNSLFIALKGPQSHGENFIDDAIRKGAIAVVVSRQSHLQVDPQKFYLLKVEDPRQLMIVVAKRFFDDPSKKIKCIGITGTNGKTTITYLLETILTAAAKKCAVIGTVNVHIGSQIIPSKNTTPGLIDNLRFLSEMVEKHIPYCVMEVSSHGLDQGRAEAIDFDSAIFTNLTQDHLDYHQTMENYFEAKAKLFQGLSPEATAVINADDPYGKRLMNLTKAKVMTYGFDPSCDVKVRDLDLNAANSTMTVVTPQGPIAIKTELIGRYNAYNILAACAQSAAYGIDSKIIAKGIKALKGVPGRLERIHCGQDYHIFVDYAHTEDALKNVLLNLKNVSRGKIILVFGCGGERDQTKRAKMGRVACQLADFSILTNDNPRGEDPQFIMNQIKEGFPKPNYTVIFDREEAIAKALSQAKADDIVLVAGKGHEDYQIFKDKKIHFDDREVITHYLKCSS